MKLKAILKEVGRGIELAAPIASAFGVPGASTVGEAVNLIYSNKDQDNGDAIKLMGAQIDAMAETIATLRNAKGK